MVADSSIVMDSPKGLSSRMMVARVPKAGLQHFVEREGIAFIDVRQKFTVGALVARRTRLMEADERTEGINLGESHRLDSR